MPQRLFLSSVCKFQGRKLCDTSSGSGRRLIDALHRIAPKELWTAHEMRQTLILHPDSHCDAAIHIEVEVARPRPGNLLLHYYLTGIGNLLIPPVAAPTRADQLWRYTCLEAFVRASEGEA